MYLLDLNKIYIFQDTKLYIFIIVSNTIANLLSTMSDLSISQITEENKDEILDILRVEVHDIIQEAILLTSSTIETSDENDLKRYKVDNEFTELLGIMERESKRNYKNPITSLSSANRRISSQHTGLICLDIDKLLVADAANDFHYGSDQGRREQIEEQILTSTTNIDDYIDRLCSANTMLTFVAMKHGSPFVRILHSFVKPNYVNNGEYQNCLMGMIGDFVDQNTPPVIKIPFDALKCRFHPTPSWDEIELFKYNQKCLELTPGGYGKVVMVPDIVHIPSDFASLLLKKPYTAIELAAFIVKILNGSSDETDKLLYDQILKWCRVNSTHNNCLDNMSSPCAREWSTVDSLSLNVATMVNKRLKKSFVNLENKNPSNYYNVNNDINIDTNINREKRKRN